MSCRFFSSHYDSSPSIHRIDLPDSLGLHIPVSPDPTNQTGLEQSIPNQTNMTRPNRGIMIHFFPKWRLETEEEL